VTIYMYIQFHLHANSIKLNVFDIFAMIMIQYYFHLAYIIK